MSVKRQATTDLNHDNWDQEDDHEEMGTYKMASKDELEKRVIKTAKRRSHMNSGDDSKKSVFSGFGGFNKPKPSSFDFLANLTNGSKTNGAAATKNDNAVSSSIFNASANNSGGLFSMPVSTSPSTKTGSTFGSPSSASTPVFGVSSPQTNTTSSLFTASKADSTVKDSTINKPSSSSGAEVTGGFTIKATSNVSTPQVSSTIFGTPTTTTSKSPFSVKTNTSSSPLKIQPVTSTTSSSLFSNTQQKSNEKKDENPNKMKFYAKLKGLNESVSDWIKKHVEETPLCILSPIFNDYEKYLKEIKDEYEKSGPKEEIKPAEPKKEEPKAPFSFGIKPSAHTAESTPASTALPTATAALPAATTALPAATTASPAATGGFSFGINKASTTGTADENKPTPFSFAPNPTATSSPTPAPFSFGIGQKFSFSPNTQKPETNEEKKNENEDEDEPPKVEFTPVVEENSVFDKRCKIFVKKDGNFVDKGVGTLYIKKIEGSEKHQLIVRANTNLGNVLLNLVLASAIPTQRMGKNNVMMVCIPTPESKPPPTPILIRVKTGEEADELLETLEKYKA